MGALHAHINSVTTAISSPRNQVGKMALAGVIMERLSSEWQLEWDANLGKSTQCSRRKP